MKSALGGCFGFFLGAIIGAMLGVGAGLLWTNVFQTSCFEGYCGMLVFFSFMPLGAILGGMTGAILLVVLLNRGSGAAAGANKTDATPPRED
jgi:hypothetical protein